MYVDLLFVGCSYIVPEYSFLDARGLGAYEGKELEAISQVQSHSLYSNEPYLVYITCFVGVVSVCPYIYIYIFLLRNHILKSLDA